MPFKSQAQARYCRLLESQGRNGTWDCDKWEEETPVPISELPERVGNTSGLINKQDVKTGVMVGIAALLLYNLLKGESGDRFIPSKEKGKEDKEKKKSKKEAIPQPKPKEKPKEPKKGLSELKVGTYKISEKDIKEARLITFYFMSTKKDLNSVFLFAAKLSLPKKNIYMAPFYMIGDLRELKNRKKFRDFLLLNRDNIRKVNKNVLFGAEFVIGTGNEPAGIGATIKNIAEYNGMASGYHFGTWLSDLPYELQEIYKKWRKKL